MKRILSLATVLLILSLATTITTSNIHPARATPYVDPALVKASSRYSSSSSVQVIIVLDHIPTATDANSIQQYSTMVAPMTQLPMILTTTTFANLGSIEAYPGVSSVWMNAQLKYLGSAQTTTHNFGEVPVQHSWWDQLMHVPDVWNLGFQGQGVGVALIDTGIDATNPSLGYNFPNGLSQAPYRVIQNVKVLTVGEIVSNQPLGPDKVYVENQPNTDTSSGHGTSTAGLVAGTGDASNGIYKGAAPKANIIGLGAGDVDFIFHAVASFDYIIAHKQTYNIRVVSNSWGSDFHCSLLNVPPFDIMPDPPACRDGSPIWVATKAVHDAGIAVFFAAGNDGPGHPTINPYAEPAWVVAVGAGTESHGLTDFSSRGCTDNKDSACTNISEQQPDLVAPGMNVISTKGKTGGTDNTLSAPSDTGNIPLSYQPFYTTFGGTSAASPMAAGVAALVVSANPALTPDQLKSTMKATTDPMLGYLPFQVGTGYVNALSAVKAGLAQGFKPSTTRVQAFGDQRFIYNQFIGGAVLVTDNWQDGNFPVFPGVKNLTITVTWSTPATALQWEVFVFGPDDFQASSAFPGTDVGTLGATSSTVTFTNATFIASLNNPGQTSGTWTVQAVNFNNPQTSTITVDANYPSKASTHMKNAHDIEVDDSEVGGFHGNEEALLQLNDGTILATIPIASSGATSVTTDITQPANKVISTVQIVTVDSNANILEVRGGWVTTQADLNTRATQIQQLLLTTTDPTQISALNTELTAIQAALPTAPTTTSLPLLP